MSNFKRIVFCLATVGVLAAVLPACLPGNIDRINGISSGSSNQDNRFSVSPSRPAPSRDTNMQLLEDNYTSDRVNSVKSHPLVYTLLAQSLRGIGRDDQTAKEDRKLKEFREADDDSVRIPAEQKNDGPAKPQNDADDTDRPSLSGPAPAGDAPHLPKAPFDTAHAKAHQIAWAQHLGTEVETTNGIGMKLRLIPAGEFMMGSLDADESGGDDEHPIHRVRINSPFLLGTLEVTQGQWEAVMKTRPWQDRAFLKQGADYPAAYVGWEGAQEFCRQLSMKEGKKYRLPTEAEWEYPCRAGTQTAFHFGDDASKLGDYAWYFGNVKDEKYAHQGGRKQPNAWGLRDMHGNSLEWCSDWYVDDYYSKSPSNDPVGPTLGSKRVVRGGLWLVGPKSCRSATRTAVSPTAQLVGFRVASEVKM